LKFNSLALVAQPAVETLGWTPEQGFAWKTQVQREFSLWADSTDCDLEGSLNFYQLQALVLRSVLESGDCFTLMPDAQVSARQPYLAGAGSRPRGQPPGPA